MTPKSDQNRFIFSNIMYNKLLNADMSIQIDISAFNSC